MRSSRPYVQLDPAVIEQARQMDLLSYLRAYEPNNLVRVGGSVYCTREHDSLKISNATYKLLGITAYCSIFFVSSYLVSFVIASISQMPIDLNKNTWLLFFLLLLLSVIVLQLFIMLAWNFKSTFIKC